LLEGLSAPGRKQKFKLRHYRLAEGISRSTWYRRQKKARELAAAAQAEMARQSALDRLEWQMTRLRADLEIAARFADEGAAILAELAAMASGVGMH
jgi:hypothetical protein